MFLRSSWATGAVTALLLAGTPAAADSRPDVAACLHAYEESQSLRDEHKLGLALITCSDDACPLAVRKECFGWLRDVEAAMPTVTVRAVDSEGRDVFPSRIALDDAHLDPTMLGRATPVDPGPHTVHAEANGLRAVDVKIVAGEGEKNRVVLLVFRSVKPPAPPRPAAQSAVVPGILYGVAAAALAGFALVDATAWGDYKHCQSEVCSADAVHSIKTRMAVGDGLLLGGLVFAGAATVIVLLRPRAER
jgi:hypothetical protein